MLINLILLIIGLALLIKGADIFVDGISAIARIFKVSEMLIGITLVCFGTSLPELFLSVKGSIEGVSEFVIGNIVGTNIFNMCAILGLVCVMSPIKLLRETVRKDMYMSLVTAIVFFLVIFDTPFTSLTQNLISRTEGIILIMFFLIFMYYTVYEFGGFSDRRRKRLNQKTSSNVDNEQKAPISKEDKRNLVKNILIAIVGGILVYFGSEMVLDSARNLAYLFKLSETFIAIMIIAIGTSLPEIATSIVAVKKGSINIAIGNLIGSNMYNMLFVVGLAALVNPIALVTTKIWIDAIIFIIITLVVVTFAKARFVNRGQYELARTEGIILICIYILYVIYVVFRG